MSISSALTEAIRSHPVQAVQVMATGFTSLMCGLIGFVAARMWSRVTNRGSLSIVKSQVHASYATPREHGEFSAAYTNETLIMTYHLKMVLVNTFPDVKAFIVEEIAFTKGRGKRASLSTEVLPDSIAVWIDGSEVSDGLIYPRAFANVTINGRKLHNGPDARRELRNWTHVRMTLLIAPRERLQLWHELGSSPHDDNRE